MHKSSGNSITIVSVDDFSFAKIRVELCLLKIKKSSGLKNIHTRFLKTGAEVRAEQQGGILFLTNQRICLPFGR